MNQNWKDPMDDRLEGTTQQTMRAVIKGLPEDTVSMTWRSALNERLVAEAAAKQKRRSFGLFLRPAFGLGLACTLALVVTLRNEGFSPKGANPPAIVRADSSGLEAALVSAHQQSALASDVAGVGVSPVEMVTYNTGAPAMTPDTGWSEEDLSSL